MRHSHLDSQRILLVEDDDIFTIMLEEFLSNKKVIFNYVRDLNQARQLLLESSFDLILLDNYLPDGLGIELMSFLHNNKITSPVIMITADDDQVSMQQCFENGVSDYILKPINLQLMWFKIERCINTTMIEEKLNTQNKKLERLLDEKQYEENLARHVYKHLTDENNNSNQFVYTYLQSFGAFNGDFFLEKCSPKGNYFIILGDATGHGLAAAISVLPVLSILRTMIKKGFSLNYIIYELNSKIYKDIPDDRFIACIGIEIDFQKQQIYFFNGGMPKILILEEVGTIKEKIKSKCLPLGILSSKEFSANIQKRMLSDCKHLLLYSDGLTEQTSIANEYFGQTQFLSTLTSCNSVKDLFNSLKTAFIQHIANTHISDDVSLCYIDLHAFQQSAKFKLIKNNIDCADKSSQLRVNLELNGSLLAKTNIVSLLAIFLKNTGISVPLQQKSFTIFSELINNGLDHGILKLDSTLKDDIEGFSTYLEEREVRLNALSCKDKLTLELVINQPENTINFYLKDSGAGFNLTNKLLTMQSALSGRGVNLVKKLSEQYIVHEPGNKTSVLIK